MSNNDLITAVLTWGRQHGEIVDDPIGGRFDPEAVEQLRRHLYQLYRSGSRFVSGSRRKGYSLLMDTGETVGVSSGRRDSRFRVYYRPANKITRRMVAAIRQKEAEASYA